MRRAAAGGVCVVFQLPCDEAGGARDLDRAGYGAARPYAQRPYAPSAHSLMTAAVSETTVEREVATRG
jgi:hypothetical protein